MSWQASGVVSGPFTAEDVDWSRPYEDQDEGTRKQADFMVAEVNRAFDEGVIEGHYSLSIQGATDHSGNPEKHGEGGGRQHLYMNLTPIPEPPVAVEQES